MEKFDLQSILDKLDFQFIIDTFDSMVVTPAMNLYKSMPPESMPIIMALAGGIGLLAALTAYIIMKPSSKKKTGNSIDNEELISSFKDNGLILDMAESSENDNVIARVVITEIQDKRLKLEVIEDLGISERTKSDPVLMMFPPEKTQSGSINNFKATIISLNCKKDGCGRITTTRPTSFSNVKRRRHKRKKVIDQQFIRVKLWLGTPDSDDASFADSAPDIAVNSYDPRSGGHEDNEVINISNGGIGVSTPLILSENKFDTDADVLINIFMFNFRQKIFKPYWYAGKIRTVENLDRTTCRLGIKFTMNGTIRDENEQFIDWTEI